MPDTVRVLRLDEAPTRDIGGDDVPPWIPLRHRLGITAFGTNGFRAERAGDLVVEPHTETGDDTAADQEEMYVVVRGGATFTVAGETLDAPAGSVVFIPDPTLHRSAVATEDGTIVLAVGATAGTFALGDWEKDWLDELGEV